VKDMTMQLSAGALAEYLPHEIAQRREEGHDVGDIERRWKGLGVPEIQLHRPVPAEARDLVDRVAPQMEALYQELDALEGQSPAKAGPHEPSTLDKIRALRPSGPRTLTSKLSEGQLPDRMLGGWLGRAAGCLLGKPVEGWSRESIRAALEHTGQYPLTDYIAYPFAPGVDVKTVDAPDAVKRLTVRPRGWYRGEFDRMVRDDDMDYPLLALHVLEEYGPDFTTAQVGRAWELLLPYLQVYTAERAAYRNLINGLEPTETATHRNPFREWIGAQIRADLWGWVCPGQPERAAELAFRDAALSHVKNGIYGEMYFAAAMAASFAVPTVEDALRVGLTEIPAECRFAEAIHRTFEWVSEDNDFQRTTDRIHEVYGHYHRVHTINNAALTVMGLLYAERESRADPERFVQDSLCYTVMGGWDTDCTGATAGSLVGSSLGADTLPEKWIGAFNDRLESIVIGMTDSRFSDLTERTLAQARRLAGG
jgi:ADP-ribosylglycohydrolase